MGSSVLVVEGITDPATLEAMACNEALALAADLNLTRMRIASDAKDVIRNINEGSLCHYSSILREIESRKKVFPLITFVFESRESNQDAHNLVRSALSLSLARSPCLVC